jgi:dethiobiotin synthetase
VPAFFVTATGTDIGKTYITAGLLRTLCKHRSRAFKPIMSGYDAGTMQASDAGVLLDAMGESIDAEAIARISPWRFAAPLSPDMAATREGRSIDFAELVSFTAEAVATEGLVFIEGVGGIMVPLTPPHTTLDWMIAINAPLILVAGSYLGAISHTLSAIDVLTRADLKIAAVVVNESEGSTVPLDETCATIARYSGQYVATLPRGADRAAFAKIAEMIVG